MGFDWIELFQYLTILIYITLIYITWSSLIFIFVAYRSSDQTPRETQTPPPLYNSAENDDIADEIQAKLASIRGLGNNFIFSMLAIFT